MKLYALLDEASILRHKWSIERFLERAASLGAKIVQYRNKIDDCGVIEKRLSDIVSLFDGRVIVNDYPELAVICGGVHVGQDDLKRYGASAQEAVSKLRSMVGKECWIGISTHNEKEIVQANSLEIDYIGLGACRATGTKMDADVLGVKKVSYLASLSRHPVAAIGGVRLDDEIPNVTYHVVGSGLYED